MAVAAGGVVVRSDLAGVRMARGESAAAAGVAAAGMVRGAIGAGRRGLAAVAARHPGQAAGVAVVVAAVVAATRAVATGQRRSHAPGCRPGTLGGGTDRTLHLAVRHGTRAARWLRCRRSSGGAGAACA